MLKAQSTRVVWLLLVMLLVTMLAISAIGAPVHSQVVSDDSPHFALFQAEKSDTGATAVIATNGPEGDCNGGSEGSCGG